MRLAFVCPRRNWIKTYGPIIAAAKRRGWETTLYIPPAVLSGLKDDAHHDRDRTWQESGADACRVAWDTWDPVGRGIDWVISIGLRLPPWLDQIRAASRPVRWASLDHIQESLLQVLEEGPGLLEGWDLAATGSEEGIDALCHEIEARDPPFSWSKARGEETQRVREVFRAVGMPHLDPLVTLEKAACRAKWNLPGSGRIVLLAPAARPALLDPWWWRAYTARNPLWRRFCWLKTGPWSRMRDDRHADEKVSLMPYRDILRAFRRWADRHGAFVVAKVRDKTPRQEDLAGIADRVIGDKSFHPFTTLELCRAADAYVGLASAMAIEATAASLPQVHVLAYPSEAYEVPAYLPFRRRFYLEKGGLWQPEFFPVYDPREAKILRVFSEVCPWEANPPSPAALARLAGTPDGHASERFLDLL